MLFYYFIFSFSTAVVLNIFFIPFLRKIKCGQSIRVLGPSDHMKKNGTPTMGGIVIIITVNILLFVYCFINKTFENFFLYIYPGIAFGLVGFIDDYLKVVKKNNYGLSPKLKFLLQFIFSVIYILLFYKELNTKIDLFGNIVDIGFLYYPLIVFVFLGTTNAYNFCDGLDGLASGIGMIIILSLVFITNITSQQIYIIIIVSSILGFLCYNYHPAKVFMGDCGSLAIGGYIASLFIVLKKEIYLIVFGLPLLIEILSVIIQVIYYKFTKGKRVFLMTPLHHHFELLGLKEIEVDILFWVFTILCCLIGIAFST